MNRIIVNSNQNLKVAENKIPDACMGAWARLRMDVPDCGRAEWLSLPFQMLYVRVELAVQKSIPF